MTLRQTSLKAYRSSALLAPFIVGLTSISARAEVTISTAQTQNMSCVANVCTPTAADAVLNAGSLRRMLASGSVKVTSGSTAQDLVVAAPLSWGSGVMLTLDAYHTLKISRPISVTGTGGLTVVTNDGGTGGVFSIGGPGHVTFASLSSPLTINGQAYTLVNSLAGLANHVQLSASGSYALANDYNASGDGVYANAPVNTQFSGNFDGMGNVVSNISIVVTNTPRVYIGGIFSFTQFGSIQHILVSSIFISVTHGRYGLIGGIMGGAYNNTIFQVSATGSIRADNGDYVGGLVGQHNISSLSQSYADVDIAAATNSSTGGLAGGNIGSVVANSYATGSVTGAPGPAGGLVGIGESACCGYGSSVNTSYSAGAVRSKVAGASGGFIGAQDGLVGNDYWDITTSGASNGTAAGNEAGITGLTTTQLQAGLPPGFDPTVWGEEPKINRGLPYLLDNPPH